MNQDIENLVKTQAAASGLIVEGSFYERANAYINRHFANRGAKEKLIIEGYLAQAAIRIARSEGKASLQGEDFKAAVWLFHQPDQPDDPCIRAGQMALGEEQKRGKYYRGMLNESFAKRLDLEK